ncbi:hypothetical protein A2U01_0117777, partial [Trifolium medium]|nr:hypothetical protein [Trifolium medium]
HRSVPRNHHTHDTTNICFDTK